MRTALFILLVGLSQQLLSQSGQVFYVTRNKSEPLAGKEWDWKLFKGYDTLTTNGTFNFDISGINNLYDSVNATNLQLSINKSYLQIKTGTKFGYGAISFFRKTTGNQYKLIYKKVFVITVDQSRFYFAGRISPQIDSFLRTRILPGIDTLIAGRKYSFTITPALKLVFDSVAIGNAFLKRNYDTVTISTITGLNKPEPAVLKFYNKFGKQYNEVDDRLFTVIPSKQEK